VYSILSHGIWWLFLENSRTVSIIIKIVNHWKTTIFSIHLEIAWKKYTSFQQNRTNMFIIKQMIIIITGFYGESISNIHTKLLLLKFLIDWRLATILYRSWCTRDYFHIHPMNHFIVCQTSFSFIFLIYNNFVY